MELHHIEHKSDGGSDNIKNAIPLCFECHAEVNHYNDAHPRGRKFTPEELILHKEQWLNVCKAHLEALISAPRDADIGPLEGMLLELEYNESIVNGISSDTSYQDKVGCVLHEDQYKRSIAQGSLLLLPEDLKRKINRSYAAAGRINTFVNMYANTRPEGNAFAEAANKLLKTYRESSEAVSSAASELRKFLFQNKF